MARTRPTGEQIRFRSSRTGEHILDTYLEAAEKGNRTLPDMLDDLFDNASGGQFRASNFQFRLRAPDNILEVRVGQFVDQNAGWQEVARTFRWRGDLQLNTSYFLGDLIRHPTTKDIYLITNLLGTPPYTSVSFGSENALNFLPQISVRFVDVSGARDWAIKLGSAVDGTEFSAKHHAQAAAGSASAALTHRDDALTHRNDAQLARDAAQSARDFAQAAQSGAEAARDDAQTARDAAQASQSAAASSATSAQISASLSGFSANSSSISAGQSAAARDDAQAAQSAAAGSASAASGSASAASSSASAASSSQSAAATSATDAATARDLAADWADKAEDSPVATGPDRFSAAHWAAKAAASASSGPTALAGLQVVIAALMTGEIGPALLLAAGEEGAIIDISEPGV
jgi:hypothetical protein